MVEEGEGGLDLIGGIPSQETLSIFLDYAIDNILQANRADRNYLISGRVLQWVQDSSAFTCAAHFSLFAHWLRLGLVIDEAVPKFVKFIFTTLDHFDKDRYNRVAIEQLLIELTARAKKPVLDFWMRLMSRHCSVLAKRGPQATHQHWTIFRWSCCVILGAKEQFLDSDHVSAMVTYQTQCLGAIATSKNKPAIPTAITIFRRALIAVRFVLRCRLYDEAM